MSLTAGLLIVSTHVSSDVWDWRTGLLGALWASMSCLSFRNLKNGQLRCWLSWDGHLWHIQSLWQGHPTEDALQACYAIHVHLDLQHLLYVSLQNKQGQRQWFWLSQDTFPDRWHGFRCAVYSRSEELSS